MFNSRRASSITKIIFSILIVILFKTTAYSEDVALTWDPPDDERVTGYEIFYLTIDPETKNNFKTTAFESPQATIKGHNETTCIIHDLLPGETYAFAAKSTDNSDPIRRSKFSNVIFYTEPDESDNNSSSDTNGDNDNDTDSDYNGGDKNNSGVDENVKENGGGGGGGGCYINVISNLMP